MGKKTTVKSSGLLAHWTITPLVFLKISELNSMGVISGYLAGQIDTLSVLFQVKTKGIKL